MLTKIAPLTEPLPPRVHQALASYLQLPPIERLALAKLLLESVLSDARHEEADWMALGLAAFQREWDNDEDAIYDDWKEHYGVTTR